MSWGQPAVEPVVTCPGCGITVFASSDNTTGYCTTCTNAGRHLSNSLPARDALIEKWNDAKAALEAAKNVEMDARKALAEFAFPTPTPGTQRVELNNGWKLKLVHKINYKFEATNEQIDKAEDNCCELGAEAKFLAERIICWKAEPSMSEYKKLDTNNPLHKEVKRIIDTILLGTPAAPTLALEEPKA